MYHPEARKRADSRDEDDVLQEGPTRVAGSSENVRAQLGVEIVQDTFHVRVRHGSGEVGQAVTVLLRLETGFEIVQ